MYFEDWYKKQVAFRWGQVGFALDVAQELFSSHEIDRGSMLLLRSLDVESLGERGRCLDYGCGYGILGLALKAVRPEWEVALVDRDALAVEFSAHNARALGMAVSSHGGLDPVHGSGERSDLILWNVPGKAGSSVLANLMEDTLRELATGGLLALVVVHPLADVLREVVHRHPEMALLVDERGPEHTVLHVRVGEAAAVDAHDPGADAFDRGVFDREPIAVEHGAFRYDLTPVIGLPQYDGPDYSTSLMMGMLAGLHALGQTARSALCVRPGVGHVPRAVTTLWPDAEITCVDRDLLALRASERALSRTGVHKERVGTRFAPDLEGMPWQTPGFDLVTVMLDHQTRVPVMQRLLDDLQAHCAADVRLVIGGGSTEVSRITQLVRRHPSLKVRQREKKKGFSAILLERR